jgi:GTP-binding protein
MSIRNIAIIAHVDHGKTTLVDGLLKQAGTWRSNEQVAERVMDSMDLERERGITIMAKVASVTYGDTKINIMDTPGHADFGGEVERMLKMVDGAMLLVDASEGPLPQTRFVLRKALEAGLTVMVCVNKIDRPDARVQEVVDEIYELFIDLGADDKQIEFPILYAVARDGWCTATYGEKGADLRPMFDTIVKHIPPPPGDAGEPLQLLCTALDYDPYVGRLAVGRVFNGSLKEKQEVAHIGADGVPKKVKVNQLYTYEGMKRVQGQEIGPGDVCAVAGLPGINIGDTLTLLEDPRPLPRLKVDEPTIGMIFSANSSPFSGKEGKYVTARQIRERLEKELMTNPALRMEDTGASETMRVFGRGELQLGILIEQMRREGFELSVGKPEVLFREVDGDKHEPYEIAQLDFPETFMGVVTQKMALRKGRMTEMKMDGNRVRLYFRVPSRGLIGFRGEYLNDTRGQGLLNTLFDGYDEYAGFIQSRLNGSLISDRMGEATTYAIYHLQPRGRLFIGPQTATYEGMIVGENSRENDINVNVCREKQLTNVRSSGADEKLILTPPVQITLEKAIEYIADDELVEVTPSSIRLRKKVLAGNLRSVKRGERDDD